MTNPMAASIEVSRSPDGTTRLRDLMGEVWVVSTKSNAPLPEADFNRIIAENDGFWDVAREYKLTKE